MHTTWSVVRCAAPVADPPWVPRGATWWLGGHSSPGSAQAPADDGRWWSVLATWDDPAAACAGPPAHAGADTWHVLLEARTRHGDVVPGGEPDPFDDLGDPHCDDGPVALITVAGASDADGKAREFFRRFLHVTRDIATAPGHLVSLVQAPAVEPEAGPVLTFSVWRDLQSGTDWAYRSSRPHTSAVARQRSHRLVGHSGSVRCAVLSSRGSLGGAGDPLAHCSTTFA